MGVYPHYVYNIDPGFKLLFFRLEIAALLCYTALWHMNFPIMTLIQ